MRTRVSFALIVGASLLLAACERPTEPTTNQPGGVGPAKYSGPFQFTTVETLRNPQTGTIFCTYTLIVGGTLTADISVATNLTVTGQITNQFQEIELSRTPAQTPGCDPLGSSPHVLQSQVTGSASAAGGIQSSVTDTHPSGSATSTRMHFFSGAINGSGTSATITGTLAMSLTYTDGPAFSDAYPNTTATMTLQRQP